MLDCEAPPAEAGELALLRTLPRPDPMPDRAAYDRERALCLAADPRRRANYDAYMAANRRSARVEYLPIKLDIENVSRCNYRCTMCQVSHWEKGRRAEDMSLDHFRALLDEQYGLVEIKLQGMGEPLMAGAPFFDMIRIARARHIWVRTVTNASLLHLRDNFAGLIDTGVNEVQVSVDGATPEVFEAIRRGAVFERVVDNCKRLNAYCDARGVVRTKMWTVLQARNAAQTSALVELAASLGFRSMVFSLGLTGWGQQEWDARNERVSVRNSFRHETALALIARGQALGVTVAFWDLDQRYSTRSPDRLCAWPFERAFVASDRRTVPCCMIANPDAFEVGAAGDGFSATWSGAAYEAFRQDHLDGRIPVICRGCYE